MIKVSLLGLSMAVLALLAIASAEAHTISQSGNVFDEGPSPGNHRVWARSQLGHPNYVESEMRNYHYWCYTGCDDPRNWAWYAYNLGAGKLALRMTLWKWTGSQWAVCADTNWMYNSSTAWRMLLQGWAGLCGNGYYGNNTGGFAWIGRWIGGHMWSGYQWLP